MRQVPEHNAAKWFTVRYVRSLGRLSVEPGWYVVRVCPCHWGERITIPLPNKKYAESVRDRLTTMPTIEAVNGTQE